MAIKVTVKSSNDELKSTLLVEPHDLNDRINEVVPGIVKGITLAVETNLLSPESVISNNITTKIENTTTEKLTSLDTRVETLETKVSGVKDEVAGLTERFDDQVDAYTQINNTLYDIPAAGEPGTDDYREASEGLVTTVAKLQATVSSNTTDIENLAALSSTVTANSSNIVINSGNIAANKASIEALQATDTDFEGRIKDLEDFHKQFDDKVGNSIIDELKEINDTIDGVSGELNTLTTNTTSSLSTLNSAVSGLQDSLGACSDDIEEIKATLENGVDSNIYQSDTFAALDAIDKDTLLGGDIGIVKTLIKGTTYSYTSYVFDKQVSQWKAMDGNYNASNVYFDKDMMVTKEIGYITITNGSGTIPSEGKNLEQVFEAMFVKEQNPTKTEPSVSATLTGAGTYEVGTTVTDIKYSVSFDDGKYSFGPEPTGVEPTKWEITSTAGYSNTINPATGSTTVATAVSNVALDDVLVEDDTNFSITATATHTIGSTPITNKGNPCPSKTIAAGSKNKTSSSISGYRSFFYGAITVPTSDLTSEIIRGLTNAGAYDATKTFTISADGATDLKAFIVAIPNASTRAGITKVDSTAGMIVSMTESYVCLDKTVLVADCRGTVDGVDTNTVSYKIYAWEPSTIDSGTIHEFTLG
jgi:predicted  nucleic acid-binding Zn-ribbon protein